MQRLRLDISGIVQGVGFRPFVYRLAQELKLTGWVQNSSAGVSIEVEGSARSLGAFSSRLKKEVPPYSSIHDLRSHSLEPTGFSEFTIRSSNSSQEKLALVLPDMATCHLCIKEIFDSSDRHYLYPFTNCTHCGPRYSIVEALPYDRANTSMNNFTMCADCREEYEDPFNRRFHAQPNACSACGPHMALWDEKGGCLSVQHEAVLQAVAAIENGRIVAVKGLGGFHLMVDAQTEESVRQLRRRKHREEKPFAVMAPSLDAVTSYCHVSAVEEQLLLSPEAPIVLLEKKPGRQGVSFSVAPNNPYLGVMLPYTPLHHILMKELGCSIVATSANLSDEPMCIDEHEALERLTGIADVFLVHNRPIVRHVDDSVVRVMAANPMMLRRARGYAPLPVRIKNQSVTTLAVGGHLKNTVALAVKDQVFVSQHIGDLETPQSLTAFRHTIETLQSIYDEPVKQIVCDQHPDYLSTQEAKAKNFPLTMVQHHHAHVVACMAEHGLEESVFGIVWDGTGYGSDGSVWGGEFLSATLTDFQRFGHFRQFPLPGGEAAIKEPWRAAAGLLYSVFGDEQGNPQSFTRGPLRPAWILPLIETLRLSAEEKSEFQEIGSRQMNVVQQMLIKGINSPLTSSVGRLFDAVAALVGLRTYVVFEGQAACMLEYVAIKEKTNETYDYTIIDPSESASEAVIVDWQLMIEAVLVDVQAKIPVSGISAKFHNTLIEIAVDMARRAGENNVVLSGGCFQNKYLTEGLIRRLREEGFSPYWPQRFPPNDGSISLGQAVVAINKLI